MTTSTPTAARPRSRLWVKLAIAAILLLGTPLGCLWYLSWSEEREFQALLAETDRLDPGWRLEDMLAARPALPDERNSAQQAKKAWNSLVGPAGSGEELETQLIRLPPNQSLAAPLSDALSELLAGEAKARAEALLLKGMPHGRSFVPAGTDWENYPFDRFRRLLDLGRLMELDAVLAAEKSQPAQVAASLRAGINLGRSVGDEPALMGQMIANACLDWSMVALERALAQLELPEAELTAIQKLLERELDEPRMVWAMRGERAAQLALIEGLENGRIKRSAIQGSRGKYTWVPDWVPWVQPIDRISLLRAMNELVEAAKLPVEQQLDEIQRLQAEWESRDVWMAPKFLGGSLTEQIGDRTRLRSAIPALAAERYRQQHGDWPASLDTLVQAGLLKAVPLDPYDGKALRFRRRADGVVIYSVGMDRVDNGGNIRSPDPKTPATDIGFRLWDQGARPHAGTP